MTNVAMLEGTQLAVHDKQAGIGANLKWMLRDKVLGQVVVVLVELGQRSVS